MKKSSLLILILFLALPFFADACPLCQGGAGYTQATLTSYKVITGFLATLPMIMGGGIFLWIRKKSREAEK